MGPYLPKKMSGPGLATPPSLPVPVNEAQTRADQIERRRRLLREHPSDVDHVGHIVCGCGWRGTIPSLSGSPERGWNYSNAQLNEWRDHRRDVGLMV